MFNRTEQHKMWRKAKKAKEVQKVQMLEEKVKVLEELCELYQRQMRGDNNVAQ